MINRNIAATADTRCYNHISKLFDFPACFMIVCVYLIYTCVYIHIYICTIDVCVYIYICIYIHTHTSTSHCQKAGML